MEREWREALAFFLTEKVPEFSTEQGAVFPPRRESTGLLSGSFPAMEREWREALAFFLTEKVPEFSTEQGAAFPPRRGRGNPLWLTRSAVFAVLAAR